jgi:hypothetical protein
MYRSILWRHVFHLPEKLNERENQEAKAFITYTIIFIGFLFVLIFGRVVEFFFKYHLLSPIANYLAFCGAVLFFAVNAFSMGRILVIYTEYKLEKFDDQIRFISHIKWSLIGIFCAHLFLVLIPCWVLESKKSIFLPSDTFANYYYVAILDFLLLFSSIGMSIFYKWVGLRTEII